MKLQALFERGRVDAADSNMRQWRTAVALALGLCLATAALVWLAYTATRQWQRGTELLQERRAAEALALAHAALVRDMKGAWVSFLVPLDDAELEDDPPYELLHRSAQTFAKFPYVEAVIVWKRSVVPNQTYAFIRSERQPRWDHTTHPEDSFPALMLRGPLPFGSVLDFVDRRDTSRGPFALIDTAIEGTPYQIVARIITDSGPEHRIRSVVALAINLDWVRSTYFEAMLEQIASIGGTSDAASFSVSDDAGQVLARIGPQAEGTPELERRFPLIFLEPTALRAGAAPLPTISEFTVHVRHVSGPAGQAVLSFRVLLLVGFAATASVVALLQTIRAVRGTITLASMKSEFVSAVTHELKTPLVSIRLIGETLERGRYASTDTIRDYAQMLSAEAAKLSQSIDHLLTYARYSAPLPPSAIVQMDVSDVIDDAVDRFRATLGARNGVLRLDYGSPVPHVWGDARATGQALEIILDNAIKYSTGEPQIAVTVREQKPFVVVTVADQGVGIHHEDLPRVHERFFRGRNASANGSGLGLAIARRILDGSGGELRIQSELNLGTQVHLWLRTERA